MGTKKGREIQDLRNRARKWGKTGKQTRTADRRKAIKEGELEMITVELTEKQAESLKGLLAETLNDPDVGGWQTHQTSLAGAFSALVVATEGS